MKKIAIVADSNSGIRQSEVEGTDIYVLPMPFIIGEDTLYEDIDLTQEQFYEKQAADIKITTSQPNIEKVTELWDELLKKYDQVIHIPMTSALSMSCETANNLAQEYPDRVFVVDNKRISITQKSSAYDADKLAKMGWDGKDIKEYLEKDGLNSSIYLVVDTLKYLKRGGRVTPAAAAISAILGIHPILQIQGGKIDKFALTRNIKGGKQKMIDAIKSDIEKRFQEYKGSLRLAVAHTTNYEAAEVFKKELEQEFPDLEVVYTDPLSLSVATHTGPKVLAMAVFHYVK